MDNKKNTTLWLVAALCLLLIAGLFSLWTLKVNPLEKRVGALEIRLRTAESNIESLKFSLNQLVAATPNLPHLKEKPKELY
ncbi:MAG: hypothetical protein PHH14_04825 [Candidatus Margulisbacteria bacterium]|nr:hypothetical protein [Candidatus Margulisiibacteriota bacterium]